MSFIKTLDDRLTSILTVKDKAEVYKVETQTETEILSTNIYGHKLKDTNLTVLSTFGAGSIKLGDVTLRLGETADKNYQLRTEFYTIARDEEDIKKAVNLLAQLVFILDKDKPAFMPGAIVEGLLPKTDKLTHIFFSPTPLGWKEHEFKNLTAPIASEDKAVIWVAVNPISADESIYLRDPNRNTELFKFLKDLRNGAYQFDRKALAKSGEFSEEATQKL